MPTDRKTSLFPPVQQRGELTGENKQNTELAFVHLSQTPLAITPRQRCPRAEIRSENMIPAPKFPHQRTREHKETLPTGRDPIKV